MRRANQIPALTGIRGVAAVWVVLFHLEAYLNGNKGTEEFLPFVHTGFLGVDLFFILSGAVMYHVHASDFRSYSRSAHVTFLKLRLARVYPLHLFCLLSFAIALWLVPDLRLEFDANSLDLSKFLSAFFLMNNWGFSSYGAWNPPTWSLSAEWMGYIFFPFIVIWINKAIPKGYEVLTAGFLLIFLVATVWLMHFPTMNQQGKVGILRMACEFTTGCLLYRYSLRNISTFQLRSFCFGVAIVLVSAYDIRFHWGAVFGMALLVMSLCKRHVVAEIIFANPVIFWFGEISFSLYLSHWPLIRIFSRYQAYMGLNPKGEVIVMVSAIFLFAVALYYFVENPSRKYLRKKIAYHTPVIRGESVGEKVHI